MKNNRLLSALVSLAIAFGLWLYVVNFVSSEHTETFYNIPIAYEGETVLAERKLMITSGTDTTVNLTLTGSRSDLAKVDKNNITLKVDLNKVYQEGDQKLEYTISFPGDVPSNAFVVESKYPSTVAIKVEEKLVNEIPVIVGYTGSANEGFLVDKENAALDYPMISVTGPASVVSLIDHAYIEVDLEGRSESVSESYRYTLRDAEGNPVDASMVVTDTAEVRLDLSIRRIEEILLTLEVNYGGGATEDTVAYTIEPGSIQVSGSDALLAELEQINLGSVDFATITEDQVLEFPITLPEGVTNESGVTDAVVTITFKGLTIQEYTADRIRVINVPAGMEYTLLNQVMKVTLRGPEAVMKNITAEDIVITVDLSGQELGSSTVKASVSVSGEEGKSVGALGAYSVSVTLKEAVEETVGNEVG